MQQLRVDYLRELSSLLAPKKADDKTCHDSFCEACRY